MLTHSSKFIRNLIVMLSGSVTSQVITMALYPLLSRFFTPSDFGSFALVFVSINVVGLASTGAYHQAIIV